MMWRFILVLTGLFNLIIGSAAAFNEHYDKGAFFIGLSILAWLFAVEENK